MKQNITTDRHTEAYQYNDAPAAALQEEALERVAVLFQDLPHFYAGNVCTVASQVVTLHIGFPYLAQQPGRDFTAMTQEQLERWTMQV